MIDILAIVKSHSVKQYNVEKHPTPMISVYRCQRFLIQELYSVLNPVLNPGSQHGGLRISDDCNAHVNVRATTVVPATAGPLGERPPALAGHFCDVPTTLPC